MQLPSGPRVEISEWNRAQDNNYAEYAALLVALEYAAARACPSLKVFSDSEVVVRQVRGLYKCQSPGLRKIHALCRTLIGGFEQFTITHIRREQNWEADRLANAALEKARKNRASMLAMEASASLLESALARAESRLAGSPQPNAAAEPPLNSNCTF